MAHTSAAKI